MDDSGKNISNVGLDNLSKSLDSKSVENITNDFSNSSSPVKVKKKKIRLSQTGAFSDICKVRTYWINLILIMIIWISTCFGFYLINFNIKYLKGNVFYNYFLSSFSQVISIIVSGLMFKKLGVKVAQCTNFTVSVFGALLYIFLSD